MIELFQAYSLTEILAIVITLALAFKGLVSFIDWYTDRIKKIAIKTELPKKNQDTIADLKEELDELKDSVFLLIESDKDNIKSYITERHHYFCYEKKYIDDFSLECLERRFEHYKQEKGNSFITDFMNDLRALPNTPPENLDKG